MPRLRPRYRRRSRTAAGIGLLLLLLVAVRIWRAQHAPPLRYQAGPARVERVVDGDTLLLVGGQRVRLIGIDTPETVRPDHPPEPFGAEASAFTKQLVAGREVRLEFDRQRIDRYGRALAYVYVDGLLLNEEIIRHGYSRAATRFPFRADMQRRFLAAQAEAREAGRGIWSTSPPSADTSAR